MRDELVNEILNYLFKKHDYDIRWRVKDYCTTLGGHYNEENEKKFPVEFFVVNEEQVIAYRYTPFGDFNPRYLPEDFYSTYMQADIEKIDKWYYINWEVSKTEELKKEHGHNGIEDKFQKEITIENLFRKYFSYEEFTLFLSKVQDAVKSANMIMGFQTIPKLVPDNLAVFKEKILNEIQKIENMKYRKITEKGSVTSEEVNILFKLEDTQTMQYNFYTRLRRNSLIGSERFAQSFITSEYLYEIFKGDASFDYTAIVCGYIKSIEQMCECIIFNILPQTELKLYYPARRLEPKEIRELCNKKELKKDKSPWCVLMKNGNQKYINHNLTMNQMFYFFKDNKDVLFEIDTEESVPQMLQCMINYCNFDRNGYLHKYNIEDQGIVERIRENTLLIHYWLLGTIRMTKNPIVNAEILGVIDDSFDKLFRKIAYRHRYKYLIDLGDGVMHKVIKAQLEKPKYYFDKNGQLCDAELIFIYVLDYPDDYVKYYSYLEKHLSEAQKIVINEHNLPKKMWWIEEDGSKKIIYNQA